MCPYELYFCRHTWHTFYAVLICERFDTLLSLDCVVSGVSLCLYALLCSGMQGNEDCAPIEVPDNCAGRVELIMHVTGTQCVCLVVWLCIYSLKSLNQVSGESSEGMILPPLQGLR